MRKTKSFGVGSNTLWCLGEEERKDFFFVITHQKFLFPPLPPPPYPPIIWCVGVFLFCFCFLMVKWEKSYPSCQLCILLWSSIVFVYSVDHLGKVGVREVAAVVSCSLTTLSVVEIWFCVELLRLCWHWRGILIKPSIVGQLSVPC